MFAEISKIKFPLITGLVFINLIIVVSAIANGVVSEPLISVHDQQSQFLGSIASGQIDPANAQALGIFKLAIEQYEMRNELVDSILTVWQLIAVVLAVITLLLGFLVYGFVRSTT